MIELIKKILPRKVILLAKLIKLYLYDIVNYVNYSSTFSGSVQSEKILAGRITAHYHVIEKGLSFKEVKLGYGKDMINSLIHLLEVYRMKYNAEESFAYNIGVNVLLKYIEYHEEKRHPIEEMKSKIIKLKLGDKNQACGIISLEKEKVMKYMKGNFDEFMHNRYSVRNFAEQEVQLEDIVKALQMVRKSPSVCNRQSARVYIIADKQLKKEVLNYQKGNRGFGHLINKLLVVTSSLSVFEGAEERNQCYVDAGIYAMNLLYALHYQGLGACALCWYVKPQSENEVKRSLKIDADERIILLVGVGHLPEKYSVAESNRLPLERTYKII